MFTVLVSPDAHDKHSNVNKLVPVTSVKIKLRVRRSLNLNVCLRKISIYSGSKSILV